MGKGSFEKEVDQSAFKRRQDKPTKQIENIRKKEMKTRKVCVNPGNSKQVFEECGKKETKTSQKIKQLGYES